MSAPARTTSVAAKVAIGPVAKNLRQQVFLHLLSLWPRGATLNEIEAALEMPGNTVRPRRIELEKKGFVKDSGDRRLTPTGRNAIVWVVPDAVARAAQAKLKGSA
jgi:hypothetical protein